MTIKQLQLLQALAHRAIYGEEHGVSREAIRDMLDAVSIEAAAPGLHPIMVPVPAEVSDALTAVQTASPSAFVAGGCLRDTYFGVEFKDIDIFVPEGFDPDQLPNGWYACVSQSPAAVEEYRDFFGDDVITVWEVWHHAHTNLDVVLSDIPPHAIQVVERRSPGIAETLADFDYGFCQIAYDGAATVANAAFMQDATNNTATMTLRVGDPRIPSSIERGERFQVRYPTRRFVVPTGIGGRL